MSLVLERPRAAAKRKIAGELTRREVIGAGAIGALAAFEAALEDLTGGK